MKIYDAAPGRPSGPRENPEEVIGGISSIVV